MTKNAGSEKRMTLRQYCLKKPRVSFLLEQWHPTKNGDLTPDNVFKGSGTVVWWKCENGHEWQTQVGSRKNGTGCPYCRAAELKKKKLNKTTKATEKTVAEYEPLPVKSTMK